MIRAAWSVPEIDTGGYIVQAVTNDHILVWHQGFECSGREASTIAVLTEESRKRLAAMGHDNVFWITPGLTQVKYANNVDRRRAFQPLTPGVAYILKADLIASRHRICGVPYLDEINPDFRIRKRQIDQEGAYQRHRA